MVFAKNEIENLTQAERNSIKSMIEHLEKILEQEGN
jgi:hypothetical protein